MVIGANKLELAISIGFLANKAVFINVMEILELSCWLEVVSKYGFALNFKFSFSCLALMGLKEDMFPKDELAVMFLIWNEQLKCQGSVESEVLL